ncbi:MAG: hypothetical protein C4335_10330 [Armatimonadota bacterium]
MNRQRQAVSLPVSFVDALVSLLIDKLLLLGYAVNLRSPHNEGLNATFVGGHVKWWQLRSITTADFGAPEPGYPYTSNRSEMGCP